MNKLKFFTSLSLSISLLMITSISSIKAQPQTSSETFSVEQSISKNLIKDIQLSPQRDKALLLVSNLPDDQGTIKTLWLLEIKTHKLKQLTNFQSSNPRWSPDGQQIAFLGTHDGNTFLQTMAAVSDKTKQRVLSDISQEVNLFEWLPNSKTIVYTASQSNDNKIKLQDDIETISSLYQINIQTNNKKLLLTGKKLEVNGIQSMNEQLILFGTEQPFKNQKWNSIYLFDSKRMFLKRIHTPPIVTEEIYLSPNKRYLAYISHSNAPIPYDLYSYDLRTGIEKNLTSQIDQRIEDFSWNSDNTITFTSQYHTRKLLCYLNPITNKINNLSITQTNPFYALQTSKGEYIFAGETAVDLPEVWYYSPHKRLERITNFNKGFPSSQLIKPVLISYPSNDGTLIEGMLLKPKHIAVNQKLPLIVMIHGGPAEHWSEHYDPINFPWGQILVSKGYVVFYPNVRGSSGYGYKFLASIRRDWASKPYQDLMSGVDYLIHEGIVDPNRMGIGGWSYGGYLAAWTTTQTNRFKAAVIGAPVTNLISQYGTEDDNLIYDTWYYSTPFESIEPFIKTSPLTFVKNVKTPSLILQGKNDTTDTPGQSQEYYRGLKQYQIPAKLVLYEKEAHAFNKKPFLMDRTNQVINWFDSYLK